jgi:hypothetical protein
MKNGAVTILFSISLFLFLVSLALPAFETNVTYMIESRIHEPSKSFFGYEALLLGWASVFFGTIAWLANIGYLVTLILVRGGNKLSLPTSVVTLMIALSSLAHPTIERGENGYDFYISHFNSGFCFWLGAIVFLCAAALIQLTQPKDRE